MLEGSRHNLKVEGKHISGWVTFQTAEGKVLLFNTELEGDEEGQAKVQAEALAAFQKKRGIASDKPAAAAEASNTEPAEVVAEEEETPLDEEGKLEGTWSLMRKKPLAMHSGTDSSISEKIGTITNKTPVQILERRDAGALGIRAYAVTIPSQSNIRVTCALNEFNHSVQRFASVGEYEAARVNYLEDIVVREAHVEDAITGYAHPS